jgi:hypothetical protein
MSSRSYRTTQPEEPWFTCANGTVWICPLSAMLHTHGQSGGSRSVSITCDRSPLLVSHVRGPTAYAAFGFPGGACQSSR